MTRRVSEAIALRRTPFGETSQIVEFLTRASGRQVFISKGVFRPRARKGGGVDLLDRCQVTWTARRGSRSLPQLIERRVLDHHPGLRSREDLALAGTYLVELVQALVPEAQPVPRVYDLATAYLEALEARPAPAALAPIVFALQGGILRLTGFDPVLDRCVACDRRPDGHRMLRCDPGRGGIVCTACRDARDDSFLLSSTAAGLLRTLAGCDPRRVADVSIPPRLRAQMRHFYDRVLLHVLERPPRCRVLHLVTA
ncbi:MAG: DNA repair protein RecO [Planctomycetes bacterium]|nr:DNA repair protein RecO [Planctomycetota bacterium]